MNIKTFYIETLGCKVNQYESQVIREGFLQDGYIEAVTSNEADICVINTCTVTSTSDSKSLRLIRNAVKKDRCVIATGCMVEDRALDLSSIAGVRFIIKNKDKYRIPEIINNQQQRSEKSKRARFGITSFKGHTRVFVKVQDGCDNTCSYCKVRVVRGRSRSRPFKEVVDECTYLVRNGSKEIVLTGICLGDYGKDLQHGTDLCRLIKELCRIEGDWRLRLSSIEPKDITEGLIQELGSQEKLCSHLHIPFQSGDDDILKRMKRPYTRSAYLDIVKRLKETIADIAITTDIMVGFPGETEKRFGNTLDFVKTINPMRIHVFPF
ncbi:MAG: tRNA (N(6)-L-threonylcarbamoyladenosine(37)-C(2))-methylthiotransferase MtaB, partial [Candidatus Omnitrophota bacterium]